MGQKRSLFPIVALVMLLIASQTVYSEDYTQVELTSGNIECDSDTYRCTSELEQPFTVPLTDKEYTVYYIIPQDLDLYSVRMEIYPEEGNAPSDVTIMVGDAPLDIPKGGFSGYKCTEDKCKKELAASMNNYIKANPQGEEYTISLPIVLKAQKAGTIRFTALTVTYRINIVEGLESTLDSAGVPEYFFWKPGKGPNPKYEVEIRSGGEDFSSPSVEPLLEKSDIVGTYWKLTEEDKSKLTAAMEPGKTYSYGVKVKYGKVGESKWRTHNFTFNPEKPPPATDIQVTPQFDGIQASWKGPDNATYDIALNGNLQKTGYATKSCFLRYGQDICLHGCGQDVCCHGYNLLTIWAVIGNQKSEATNHYFLVDIDTLKQPEIVKPSAEVVRTKDVDFEWKSVENATMYEIQLRNSSKMFIELPLPSNGSPSPEGDGIIRVLGTSYSPGDPGIELTPGEMYFWRVRAIAPGSRKPGTDEPMEPSDWAETAFTYQPVLLRMLVMFSAIGGVMGGFIRVAQEERTRAREKNERMKIYLDYQTSVDLLVGLIIGIMFYLMVNQTLSQELNPLNIPPLSYAGSVILGFIGGVLSYDLTRLRRVMPE